LTRNLQKVFVLLTLTCSLVSYTPLIATVEKQEKIQAADQLLGQNSRIQEKYEFEFHGKSFVGYPNVYSPVIFPGAGKQADLVVHRGERFLELGSGTGVFSVLAALAGADTVVAVDINPDAVANTRDNAERHGVTNTVKALEGDMFLPLNRCQQFDVIFFNIPFCHRNCDIKDLTMLGRSLFDPEHDLLHRYLKEGHAYLAPGGRMMLGYSTTHGDIHLMRMWAEQYHWDVILLHKVGDENKDFITIELYEFRPQELE
jgi:release factor glutamine methyltransferase